MSNLVRVSPNIQVVDGELRATSKEISEFCGKQHKDVLRAIQSLECSEEFHKRNFALMLIDVEVGNGANRKSKIYEITRDGCAFLITGFTGKKAAAWKEAYITAFSEMEKALREAEYHQSALTTEQRNALYQLVDEKGRQTGQRSKLPFIKLWQALHAKFQVPRYHDIPYDGFEDAMTFISEYPLDEELGLIRALPAPDPEKLASLTGPEGLPEHHTEVAYILRRNMENEGDMVDQIEHRLHDLTGWIGYLVCHCRKTQSENEDLHKKLDGISRLLAPHKT